MFALKDFFSYVPLTEMVTRVMGGIPRVLPDPFYSLTRPVLGDRYRRTTFRGTRQLARTARYGSPPRNRARVGRGTQDMVMLHTIEQMQASHELLMLLRKFDDYVAQSMARDLIRQDAEEFGRLFDNLRVAAITSPLALGHIYLDSDGNLLTSSAGADLDIDYGIPATNTGQVNGIIAESWDDPDTDIPTQINNLKTYALQKTGYKIEHAFYGKNVAGYLARNNSFQRYLSRNPEKNQQYVNSGQIPAGVLDLTWHPVQDAFFADANNTVTELFPADQVTFYPKIDRQTYELVEGGYPVPKEFAVGGSIEDVISKGIDYVHGVFKFAYMMPGLLQINMAQGDTFLPDHKVPESIFLADVAF